MTYVEHNPDYSSGYIIMQKFDFSGATPATLVINLGGVPALSLPVPAPSGPGLPASIQLVGPHDSEASLLALGGRVQSAAG